MCTERKKFLWNSVVASSTLIFYTSKPKTKEKCQKICRWKFDQNQPLPIRNGEKSISPRFVSTFDVWFSEKSWKYSKFQPKFNFGELFSTSQFKLNATFGHNLLTISLKIVCIIAPFLRASWILLIFSWPHTRSHTQTKYISIEKKTRRRIRITKKKNEIFYWLSTKQNKTQKYTN